MRAAIYTRYSTDLQNARSIEDQLALCRDHAAREGLTIVATLGETLATTGNSDARQLVRGMIAALCSKRT